MEFLFAVQFVFRMWNSLLSQHQTHSDAADLPTHIIRFEKSLTRVLPTGGLGWNSVPPSKAIAVYTAGNRLEMSMFNEYFFTQKQPERKVFSFLSRTNSSFTLPSG